MKWTMFADQLADSRIKTLIFAGLAVVLALALLANGLFRGGTVVVMVPPEVDRSMWAAGNTASPEYMTKVAMPLIAYLANVHPESVDLSFKTFMGFVAPESAGVIQERLNADKSYILDRQMSRVFYPMQTQVVKDSVTLIGLERRFIAGTIVADNDKRYYRLKLRMNDWKLQVVDLDTGKPEDQGGAPTAMNK
ncbi:MAG TPA: TraE/TraK family type IV conjugative transfer system protein [Nitrospira sp.]|nr:TraE/TraK family type IV conjugative transfer system protein [Nitrospira sp.]